MFVVLSFTDKIFRESEWFLDEVVHDAVVADVRVGGIFLKSTKLINYTGRARERSRKQWVDDGIGMRGEQG